MAEQFEVRGWPVVRLASASLTVDVLPEFGAAITSVRRTADDLELMHQTPWGLPSRGVPQLSATAEVQRFDVDPGGWQSIFPNGGDTVTVEGADQGHDGEARISPFEIAELTDAEIRMTTRLRRSPVEMTKIVSVSDDTVTVTESVRNVGVDDRDVMWGSTLQFGPPLISKDTEVECPTALVHPDATILYDSDYEDVMPWPRTPGRTSVINLRYLPEPGSENRMAYLTDLDRTRATITNRVIGCTVALEWEAGPWPYLWYCLEAGGTGGYPWFGNGYFLALTPSSSWPAHGLHDARRISASALKLPAGEELTARLSIQVSPA
ncbi:MAG: hypothetical protein J2P23_02330 [Microlunatus sp.]|nr:hypothetical protein [Microlunatus sp.]